MLSKKDQKYIKSLKVKKYRVREKRFLVEGAKNVQELLSSDFEVELLVGTDRFIQEYHDSSSSFRAEVVKADLLEQIGTFKTNDTALAVAKMRKETAFELDDSKHLIVLDGVGDPGNMGTIIRTLDWFGFSELLCSPDCAEFYHPKVINSTMGSFTRVNVIHSSLEHILKDTTMPILAADMDGIPLYSVDTSTPSIIVMGSESHGIRQHIHHLITQRVTIPRYGQAESLNVGVATGIFLGHFRMSK